MATHPPHAGTGSGSGSGDRGVTRGDASARNFLKACVMSGVRWDGRSKGEYRPLGVQVKHQHGLGCGSYQDEYATSGSARVALGGTAVLAAVSLEICAPDKLRPASGIVKVSVDCSMRSGGDVGGSSSNGEKGKRGSEKFGEGLARHIEMIYLGSNGSSKGCLDLENNLSLVEGHSVWMICVDCIVLDDDGNLLDALSIAVREAIRDTKMPNFEVIEANEAGSSGAGDIQLTDDPNAYWRLKCGQVPILVTLLPIDAEWIVDATSEEEAGANGSCVSFGVNARGAVTASVMHGQSISALEYRSFDQLVEAACIAGRKVLASLDALEKEEDFYHLCN